MKAAQSPITSEERATLEDRIQRWTYDLTRGGVPRAQIASLSFEMLRLLDAEHGRRAEQRGRFVRDHGSKAGHQIRYTLGIGEAF